MAEEFVIYNGVEVIAGWPERIAEAQGQPTYLINGVEYARVRYGNEKNNWGADDHPCGDCAVIKGQLHVPSCDEEQCPSCGGQWISCGCGSIEE